MGDFENYVGYLREVFDSNNFNSFKLKTGLKHLGDSVFCDSSFAYKFDPHHDEAEALRRVKGVVGVQQFVAYFSNVLVTDFVDSVPFHSCVKPQKKHLECLLQTLLVLRDKNVEFFDCNNNLLYSVDGFTVIDVGCFDKEKPEVRVNDLDSVVAGKFFEKRMFSGSGMNWKYKKVRNGSKNFNSLKKTFGKYGFDFDGLEFCRYHGAFLGMFAEYKQI